MISANVLMKQLELKQHQLDLNQIVRICGRLNQHLTSNLKRRQDLAKQKAPKHNSLGAFYLFNCRL